VRHEDSLDGKVESGAERGCEILLALSRRKPGRGAHADASVLVAEQHVAGNERCVLRDPVDDLASANRPQRLDPARERVARPEGVGDRAGPPRDRRAGPTNPARYLYIRFGR